MFGLTEFTLYMCSPCAAQGPMGTTHTNFLSGYPVQQIPATSTPSNLCLHSARPLLSSWASTPCFTVGNCSLIESQGHGGIYPTCFPSLKNYSPFCSLMLESSDVMYFVQLYGCFLWQGKSETSYSAMARSTELCVLAFIDKVEKFPPVS